MKIYLAHLNELDQMSPRQKVNTIVPTQKIIERLLFTTEEGIAFDVHLLCGFKYLYHEVHRETQSLE